MGFRENKPVSQIAGGSEEFSVGVSGLVKKNLDCTVGISLK